MCSLHDPPTIIYEGRLQWVTVRLISNEVGLGNGGSGAWGEAKIVANGRRGGAGDGRDDTEWEWM